MVYRDLHLGHANALKFRSRFQSIEQHDQHIVDSILSAEHRSTAVRIPCLQAGEEVNLSHVPLDPCNIQHQQKWNIHGHYHNGYEPTP